MVCRMQRQQSLRVVQQKIHDWYREHGRHGLPWRLTNDPYRIWISEIMLQQTQVKTVLERFYHPFLDQFPDIDALASAPRQKVMKAWEGLGYYNRAANLHEAAKIIAREGLPATVEAWHTLPGIGQNTAHAVMAFSRHHPVAVMEANVKRVLCRVFALQNPTTDELWEKAEALLDHANPFDYNQAMMDIGSMVCTRRNPDCPACPLNDICKGKTSPESYPALVKKKQVPVRNRTLLVLEHGGKYYLEKRKGKFLNGLWGFIEMETPSSRHPRSSTRHPREGGDPKKQHPNLQVWIPAFAGMTREGAKKLGSITQIYSHFRLEADVRLVRLKKPHKKIGWYSLKEIQKLPLSKADQKVLDFLKS